MKKFILFFSLIFTFNLTSFAREFSENGDTYSYDLVATSLKGVSAPFIHGDFIVFTAERKSHSVGISFDFENFSKIHTYHLRRTFDAEGNENSSWFFYLLEKPKNVTRINYRVIIDGLWSVDPTNENSVYDSKNGVNFSYIDIPQDDEIVTETTPDGFTKFVCFTDSGKKVRLAGTFTNWDSWIYEMQETAPGKYEIALPLPAGTYYYAYYVGMKSFVDTTNPRRGYSADGKTVSCLVVE